MHGLINKSIQAFLRANYGQRLWLQVAERVGFESEGFEAMLRYDDQLTEDLLQASIEALDKPRGALLEDIGAYLASLEPIRRLLRFGGEDYWEFLQSLDELQGRGQMTLPDLELPELTLRTERADRFLLIVRSTINGWGAVMTGLLRAMADDYGALAMIEQADTADGQEAVQVVLLEATFNEGRRFELARPVGGVR
ncbi:heme NO-binding domain-containing protein [Sinirhodobacter sp. WL0062]|uniref:Heme NO-binding domain-containing protein n=1 Tax=Rhodobacter flavimaris TaxID=2907145 RepID=A0ABS8YZF7_9RHOB|nr:heme NO-binding domain-containing protein [Sinirhodobacter sp. WL0062]MCE5975187.1 heme NO-binding domain-containing protein [Sinirhodobacter sp. WL0062]